MQGHEVSIVTLHRRCRNNQSDFVLATNLVKMYPQILLLTHRRWQTNGDIYLTSLHVKLYTILWVSVHFSVSLFRGFLEMYYSLYQSDVLVIGSRFTYLWIRPHSYTGNILIIAGWIDGMGKRRGSEVRSHDLVIYDEPSSASLYSTARACFSSCMASSGLACDVVPPNAGFEDRRDCRRHVDS